MMKPRLKIDHAVAGQMQSINTGVVLSVNDLWANVCAQVELYAMNTSLFETDNLTSEIVHPANFALYLFGLAYSYVNKAGQLSGDNKNDVCLHPEKLAIPVGFAKYLEHLGVYSSEGATCKTVAVLGALATTTTRFGSYVPEHFWGASPPSMGVPNFRFNLLRPLNTAVGEYATLTTGSFFTLRDLWSQAATVISQAITGAGLACVLFGEIPLEAPNASAYASCISSLSRVGLQVGAAGAVWTNITQQYEPEEALIFRAFVTGGKTYGGNFQKPVVMPTPGNSFDVNDPTSKYPDFITPHYFNAWIGSRQDAYRPGPLLRSYRLCKSRVKHLTYSTQAIDWSQMKSVAYNALNIFLRQTTIAPSAQDVVQLIYLYFQVLVHCVGARVNQTTPVHLLATTNGVTPPEFWSPQAGYLSRSWLSIELPALLARYVDSIGPINVKGYVTVPVLRPIPGASLPNYSNGVDIFPLYGIGQSVAIVPAGELGFADPGLTLTEGTVPALNFAPRNTVLTQTEMFLYYPSGVATERMLFWNIQMPYFSGVWDRLHKKLFSGSGIASSMIHLHNPPCGTVSAMCTTVSVIADDTVSFVPDFEEDMGFKLQYLETQALVLDSYVDLGGDEIVEAAMYRFVTADVAGQDSTAARFRFQLPNSAASSQLMQAFGTNTFSPESAFSKAISEREAKFTAVVRTIGGVDIVSTDETDGCWVKEQLKSVLRQTFSSVRYATPGVAGLVCNYFLPGSGALCSAGASGIVRAVSSFVGVEADDHEEANSKDVARAIALVTPRKALKIQPVKANPQPRVRAAQKQKPPVKKPRAKASLPRRKN